MTLERTWSGGPFSLRSMLIPSGLILLVVVGTTVDMLSWRIAAWVRTSAAAHEQLLYAGPLGAAASCYVAARLFKQRNSLPTPTPAWTPATILRHYSLLCGWFIGSYTLGLIPLFIDTAVDATAGNPDIVAILVGLLGMALMVALGYFSGTLIPRLAIIPIVALATFFLLQVPHYYSSAWAALLPVQAGAPPVGRVENPTVATYRILFLAVFIAAAVASTHTLARNHAPSLRRSRMRALLWFVVPATMIPMVFVRTPALWAFEHDPPQACQSTNAVKVCVHQAHIRDLSTLVAVTQQIIEQYGRPPENLTQVRDIALDIEGDSLTPDVVWVNISPIRPIQERTAHEIVEHVAGVNACLSANGDTALTTTVSNRLRFADALTEWLLSQAHLTGLGHRATSHLRAPFPIPELRGDESPAEIQAWIARHSKDITSCTLNLSTNP